MSDNKYRNAIAACCLSAAALVGLVTHEGYTDKAVIPTKNDRPTVGFGSTFREDGSPVQMGDTITPQKAIARSYGHIAKDEVALKKCVTGPLSQAEYDTLVDFSYQYGAVATCNSSMVRFINEGKYTEACEAYMMYKYLISATPTSGWEKYVDSKGRTMYRFDCTTPGNKVCRGVGERQLVRKAKCLGET
jgi:lysozyme